MAYLAIAAAVVGAMSAYSKGTQTANQYEAYAQANAYNAALNRQKAETARSVYNQREEQIRRTSAVKLGAMRASIGEAGLGGNPDLERQSEVLAELDALNIRYEGELESYGLLEQAKLDDYQYGVNKTNASNARRSRWLGMASSALSGYGAYTGMK